MFNSPFMVTVGGLIIRLIAVAAFISGLVLGRELLQENFNPERQSIQKRYERASLPAFDHSGVPWIMSLAKSDRER